MLCHCICHTQPFGGLFVLPTNFPGSQRYIQLQWFNITSKRQHPDYDFHVATMIYSGKYTVMRNYVTRLSTSPEVNQTNWIVGFQFEEAACGSRIDPHPLYDFRWQCYLLPQILTRHHKKALSRQL